MNESNYATGKCFLLHDLVFEAAQVFPSRDALSYQKKTMTYGQLSEQIKFVSEGLLDLGLQRMDRVGIFLEKSFEFVTSVFAVSRAGGVFVPINPILKGNQVLHILNDCQISILITSTERLPMIQTLLSQCPFLKTIIVRDEKTADNRMKPQIVNWNELFASHSKKNPHRSIETDVVAIFYTSGSTGNPKGVVLSHRNMVTGAYSVSSYLQNDCNDILIAALPFSFDAGFSQLTTGFCKGAKVVLTNYLTAHDLVETMISNNITGMTAVPPLWMQIVNIEWPQSARLNLRYFANTGGRMPFEVLQKLRRLFPDAKPFLMYGLTEAFRATFLPPEEVDRRPDSIGKAIPNSEVLVLSETGQICTAGEIGELVQRGPLVSLGYWNDLEKTNERFKLLPKNIPGQHTSLVMPEVAVYSGDFVKTDEQGFLYFVGRKDEMIKTSGYRVSPTEIEETLYALPDVNECAAFGAEDARLGQAIVVTIFSKSNVLLNQEIILNHCRKIMPSYMLPSKIIISEKSLPRNPNGKIDRKLLATEFAQNAKIKDAV